MRQKQVAIFVLIGVAFLSISVAAKSQTADIAVVVNPNNRTEGLLLPELRKVFLGERRSWAVGLPIKLVVRDHETRERIGLLKLLGMSEREYKEYWIGQIFRGETDSEPLSVPTTSLEEKAILIFPGAIAFLDAREVTPEMKVLKLNGHLPGESGYPLH